MKRFQMFVLSFGILVAAAVAARALAQDGPGGPPPQDRGGPGGPGGPGGLRGGPGGPGGAGGPGGGFHLLPRFVAEKLELTAAQQKQIAKLEKETKAKLDKILTPEQRKILEQAGPPRVVKVVKAAPVERAVVGVIGAVLDLARRVDRVDLTVPGDEPRPDQF